MVQRKRTIYGKAIRRQAVRILAEGAGHRTLAARLGIPDATARQWARAFAADGAQAVLNGGSRHRVYDFETKMAVVHDHVERGKSVRDVMVEHNIPSESSVKMWCRKYRAGGAEALIDRPRGRKPRNAVGGGATAVNEGDVPLAR